MSATLFQKLWQQHHLLFSSLWLAGWLLLDWLVATLGLVLSLTICCQQYYIIISSISECWTDERMTTLTSAPRTINNARVPSLLYPPTLELKSFVIGRTCVIGEVVVRMTGRFYDVYRQVLMFLISRHFSHWRVGLAGG